MAVVKNRFLLIHLFAHTAMFDSEELFAPNVVLPFHMTGILARSAEHRPPPKGVAKASVFLSGLLVL